MNPFSITGRIGRLHYFIHSIVDTVFVVLVLLAPFFLIPPEPSADEPVISDTTLLFILIMFLATVVSEICASIRRLHDLDRSGWQVLLLFVPIINIGMGWMLLFNKGTEGPNQYGDDPLGRHEMPLDYASSSPQYETSGF